MSKTQAQRTGRDSQKLEPGEAVEIFTSALAWLRESMGIQIKFTNGDGQLILYLPGLELVPLPGTGKAKVQIIGSGTGESGSGTSPAGNGTPAEGG